MGSSGGYVYPQPALGGVGEPSDGDKTDIVVSGSGTVWAIATSVLSTFGRTATATTGPRPGIAYPTGLTDAGSYIQAVNSNTAAAYRFQGAISTQNAASTGLPTTTDSYLAIAEAVLIVGASPSGNFQITLASETSGVSVTMKAGSFIQYRTIS